MTPGQFIEKWRAFELKEMSGAQTHFLDLCEMLEVPPPDGTENYCFEISTLKDSGEQREGGRMEEGKIRMGVQEQGRKPRQGFRSTSQVHTRA